MLVSSRQVVNTNNRAKSDTSRAQGERRQAAAWRRRALPREGEARETRVAGDAPVRRHAAAQRDERPLAAIPHTGPLPSLARQRSTPTSRTMGCPESSWSSPTRRRRPRVPPVRPPAHVAAAAPAHRSRSGTRTNCKNPELEGLSPPRLHQQPHPSPPASRPAPPPDRALFAKCARAFFECMGLHRYMDAEAFFKR